MNYLCLGGLCLCLLLLAVICLDYASFKDSYIQYKKVVDIRFDNVWKRVNNHENRLVRLGSNKQEGYQSPGWEDDGLLTQVKENGK